MAYDVDRKPGGWVAAQAERRAKVVWLGLGVFFLIGGLLLALALGHRLTLTASAIFVAVVFAAKPYAERYIDVQARWLRGARAEATVGETLNELRRQGWIIMHDIEQEFEGNIDHLVSGPTGVFLIETKERRYQDEHLPKARRQAAKVGDELGVWVTPVICLYSRSGKPFRTNGVWIVPRQHLLAWLHQQHNQPVPFERLASFADRLSG